MRYDVCVRVMARNAPVSSHGLDCRLGCVACARELRGLCVREKLVFEGLICLTAAR